jgi:uncharacterized coiled-coil protein SlyX
MGTRIHELEEKVEEWNHTIEVLENQLQNTQQQLGEANEHLDMHHHEMHQDMEADKDVDIEGEDPEPSSSLDTTSVARTGGHVLQSLALPRMPTRCHDGSRCDRK